MGKGRSWLQGPVWGRAGDWRPRSLYLGRGTSGRGEGGSALAELKAMLRPHRIWICSTGSGVCDVDWAHGEAEMSPQRPRSCHDSDTESLVASSRFCLWVVHQACAATRIALYVHTQCLFRRIHKPRDHHRQENIQ